MSFECKYCSKGFRTEGYLARHYQQTKYCNAQWQKDNGYDRQTRSRARTRAAAACQGLGDTDTGRPAKAPNRAPTPPRLARARAAIPLGVLDEDAEAWAQIQGGGSEDEVEDGKLPGRSPIDHPTQAEEESVQDPDEEASDLPNQEATDDDSQGDSTSYESEGGSVATIHMDDNQLDNTTTAPVDDRNIRAFRSYCESAKEC